MRNYMFSVIVPVYNAGKTLKRCIESILKQSYQNFELLIIDDGSVDNSASICDEYACFDNRVRVLHINNSGVSVARNLGLQGATGQWVAFVDSDDWVEEDWLLVCSKYIIDSEIDIIRVGYFAHDDDKETKVVSKELHYIKSKAEMLRICDEVGYYAMVWNTFFRRKILKDLLFDERISWSEDYIFSYKGYSCCRKMLVLNHASYHYTVGCGLSNVKDPFLMKKALDLGLYHKKQLIESNCQLEKEIDKYHYHIKRALHMIYTSNWSYAERKRFAHELTLYQNASLRERFLMSRKIPYLFKDIILKTAYYIRFCKCCN